jgi:hypothetical protein
MDVEVLIEADCLVLKLSPFLGQRKLQVTTRKLESR